MRELRDDDRQNLPTFLADVDRLAEEIGARWPEGVTAAEGVAEQRRGRVPALGDATEIEPIAEWLDARFGVDALWLFGSQVTGQVGPDSDVDLAALFRNRPSPPELFDAQQDLAELLGQPVDLVDLDRASPILAMQVLRHGRLLLDRNPRRRIDFVAHAPGRYEDVLIVRREAERTLLERVRHGRS
jgi:predicted nucleotidyltransferase